MVILQIEHHVASYETWRKAFDSDPVDRKNSGVKQVKIFHIPEDPNLVVVDVIFESMDNAKATLSSLQKLWGKVGGMLASVPKTRFLELVDSIEV